MSETPTHSLPQRPPTAQELGLGRDRGLPPSKRVTLENWQGWPWNRWSYQHIDELIPCAIIGASTDASVGLRDDGPREIDVGFTTTGGRRRRLTTFLRQTCTDGFLVLHRGRIVMEVYDNGMTPTSRHLLQSVSKSITGTVAGILADRGLLDVGRPVSDYVPELASTSFRDATVRHLLDMTAGTRFSEDYEDPESDIRRYESAAGWRPGEPGDHANLLDYTVQLPNHRRHGDVFEYRSILTDLLGVVLERAGDGRFAQLTSDLLWAPMGAADPALITLDPGGNPMTDGGIAVTLRDLARFGLLHARGGEALGRQVVPPTWIADTLEANDACLRACRRPGSDTLERFPDGHYRNQWWVPVSRGHVLLGMGIYGQFLYVDLEADVVIAKMSTLPFPLDPEVSADHRRAFAAIVQALGEGV